MYSRNQIKAFLFIQIHKNESEDFSDTTYVNSIINEFCESCNALLKLDEHLTDEQLRYNIYEIGKHWYGKDKLREWFSHIYLLLMKESSGPRLDSFIKIYGLNNFKMLLKMKLNNPFV